MAAGRIGWAVLGTLLVAVAITVSIRNGVAATTAAVVFLFLPTVRWWPLRTAWIPLAVLVAFTVWPVWPPLFSAGLGWLIGIAAVRVLGRGDGWVAEPGRLGMRVLGLDLTTGGAERHPFLRRTPGPQAGRASIPRPEAAGAAPEQEAGTDPKQPPRAGEPEATPHRDKGRPPAKPANRTPRAASAPEPRNAAKPKRPPRQEPRQEPRSDHGPGPAAKPQGGQSP